MIKRLVWLVAVVMLSNTWVGAAENPALTEITPPAATGAAEPFLSTADDALLLSWLEPVAKSDRVALRFARFRDGKWSVPRTIVARADLFVNSADFPSLVADAKGVLYAHWMQKSGKGSSWDVRIATSPDGGVTWSAPFLLNRDGTKTEHGFVTLAPLPGGGVGAAWLDGRHMTPGKEEGEMTLRYAAVDARGAIRDDVELDHRTCECCTTGMAMTTGGPVIVYRDRTTDEIRDIASVRLTANGWTQPRPVHADGWKIAGCPVNGPQADAHGDRIAAAWFTAAHGQARAAVAFSDDGGATFGAPVTVAEGKPLGRLDVVMLDADTALVTWLEQTAAGAEIRARRVRRDGRVDPPVKIAESSSARAAGFPRITHLGRDVYFTWTDQTAVSKRIRVARARF